MKPKRVLEKFKCGTYPEVASSQQSIRRITTLKSQVSRDHLHSPDRRNHVEIELPIFARRNESHDYAEDGV